MRLSQSLKQCNCHYIDDITFHDLNLQKIYESINTLKTTAGEDFLMDKLRNPYIEGEDDFIAFIDEDIDYKKTIEILEGIGKLKKYNFRKLYEDLFKLKEENNTVHYITGLFIIISFILIFILPGPGVLLFFISLVVSVYTYFMKKREINREMSLFIYLMRLIKGGEKLSKVIKNDYTEEIKSMSPVFKDFLRFSFLIPKGVNTSGNIIDVLLDYLRLLFHLDQIKLNSMLKCLKDEKEMFFTLYEIIGTIDLKISIKNYRDSLSYYCVPEFINEKSVLLKEVYHPLLKNPVSNDFNTEKSVIVTGSNASGKSTFLKTVAINALFAQCFNFALAKEYKAPKFKIYSSMSLSDDIIHGDSYFTKEIKSLKRITDITMLNEKTPVLCVVDEIFKGTNTVERIGASSQILSEFRNKNVICFAATHDIELTEILKNIFDNYHFTEIIKNDDISFSYKILQGSAKTKNAVKLLKFLGFSEETVNGADERCQFFINNNRWQEII